MPLQESVLIVAPPDVTAALLTTLSRDLAVQFDTAETRSAGLHALRTKEWSLVLLDDGIVSGDPETADALYAQARGAAVLEINFAITSAVRVARQIRSALRRHAGEQVRARHVAAEKLRGELCSVLSGLLLNSQLALDEAPPVYRPKLRIVVKLVNELHTRLGVSG